MKEQIRIYRGLVYVACDFSYDLDQYAGEPFKTKDGKDIQFNFNANEEDVLTSGENWVLKNIKAEYIEPDLRKKLYGAIYNLSDYLKQECEACERGWFGDFSFIYNEQNGKQMLEAIGEHDIVQHYIKYCPLCGRNIEDRME